MGCARYPAGMLSHVIEVQAKTRTPDGMGGFTEAWAAVAGAPTRATIKAVSGGEAWAAMRLGSNAGYAMGTRYFGGASPALRVIWRGKEYAVTSVVDPDAAGRWLDWRINDGAS